MINQIKGFLLVAAYPLDDQFECHAEYVPVKLFNCENDAHEYVKNNEVDFPEYIVYCYDGENFNTCRHEKKAVCYTPVRCCKCGSECSMDWRAGETSTTCLCHDCYEKAHRFDGITFNGKPLGEIIG